MFSNIKYNLYEILNVSDTCDETIIKKSYLKLIKKFHPDKNNKIEEEIYFHIIYANQILTNKVLREKYNELLKETSDFNKLKNNNKKTIDSIISKEESLKLFNKKVDELNNKHGYNNELLIKKRDDVDININKECNPKDINEFNKIF